MIRVGFLVAMLVGLPAIAQQQRPQQLSKPAAKAPAKRVALAKSPAAKVAAPKAAPAPAPVEPALPPEQAWPKAVDSLVKSLVSGELPETEAMLAPGAAVRNFDGSRQQQPTWRLAERAVGASVVAHRAYLQTPLVLAADLAADFKSAPGVDEKTRAAFVIDDDTEIKRANATAAEWVMQALDTRGPGAVGVIVLWARPAGAPPTSTEREPLFVLVRGELTPAHTYKLTTVLFGDPAPEKKP